MEKIKQLCEKISIYNVREFEERCHLSILDADVVTHDNKKLIYLVYKSKRRGSYECFRDLAKGLYNCNMIHKYENEQGNEVRHGIAEFYFPSDNSTVLKDELTVLKEELTALKKELTVLKKVSDFSFIHLVLNQ